MYKKQKKSKDKAIYKILGIGGVAAAAILAAAAVWISGRHSRTSTSTEQIDSVSEDNLLTWQGEQYQYNDHLSNYLFLGIDTREKVETYETQQDAGQADAIYLVSMDRVEQTINVIAIPRDTMTEIEVINPSGKSLGTTENHLNLQYAYGDGKTESCRLMQTAVSNLLDGISIQGYYSVNMDGIPTLVDSVGGVEITVPDNSLEEVNEAFKMGQQVLLTKDNVEQFVRYRDTTIHQSALVRQNRQIVFFSAYLKKAESLVSTNAGVLDDIYDRLQDYTVTNMGSDIFLKLMQAAQKNEIQVITLPGEGGEGEYFDEYHVSQDEKQEMIVNTFYKKVDK